VLIDCAKEILNSDWPSQSMIYERFFFYYQIKAVLTFDSVDEILEYDHSNKNSLAVL